jgi:hypothetical protein
MVRITDYFQRSASGRTLARLDFEALGLRPAAVATSVAIGTYQGMATLLSRSIVTLPPLTILTGEGQGGSGIPSCQRDA